MTLKVEGHPGYSSMVGPGLSLTSSLEVSETLPLLIPVAESNQNTWKPLNREQLEVAAKGPGWKKFRSRLVLLYWVGWLAILGTAIMVIIQSPRPVATPLPWWHKELFYQLQPALFLDVDNTESSAISKVSERFPYLRSLGFGVVILEGLFSHEISLPNLTEIDQRLGTSAQFQQLITDSRKAGMRIILDLCKLDLLNGAELCNETDASANSQNSIRYWLEQGVSGFGICDTDSAFTEKTLIEWRQLIEEFNTEFNERIVMVRRIGDSPSALNVSRPAVNDSLVNLFSKALLSSSSHQLSATELAETIESRMKTLHGEWPSWTMDGEVELKLQRVLLVLIMTLPGTPIIRYGDEISQSMNMLESKHSTLLFKSLSQARSREETLLYGTFTFLHVNSSAHANSTAIPPLAYLRSWGCAHVLVLFNLGTEPQSLDASWVHHLPEEGVFVTSTGLNRFGTVSLQSIKLQPYEATVIKMFERGSYF